jgi:hypothetical protein
VHAITPDDVRDLIAGHHTSPVLIYPHDGEGAVVVEVAACCSINGWIVAVPEELEAPDEPGEQWFAQMAAELSERCALRPMLDV